MRLALMRESINDIDKSQLITLWYENEDGDKFIPDLECDGNPYENIPIDKFPYQVSQFPTVLRTSHLKCTEDGSKEIMVGNSSWPEELALAMANSGEYTLSQAILVAAQSCERCLNALLNKYKCKQDNGYPEGSEQWNKSNTRCQFCK